MSKQPEALRLADLLIEIANEPSMPLREIRIKSAAELRRLHALNAEMVEACKLVDAYYSASLDHQPAYVMMARAAIAKAVKS